MKTVKAIEAFGSYLRSEEKSGATVEKYVRDVSVFLHWAGKRELTRELVLEYKERLKGELAVSSVNSAISSLNRYFEFTERAELRLKSVRVQRQIFARRERELSRGEYDKLLSAAKRRSDRRLFLLLQTICSTGIRVSELRYITVAAIARGQANIELKGKSRVILLPRELCKLLKRYVDDRKIKSGSVFVSKRGKPLDRSNIWKMMKSLCADAGVAKSKVFPHNLRHLFARTYYAIEKDIARLADILGHSSIETTRIYTMETGEIHRRQVERLGLLRC